MTNNFMSSCQQFQVTRFEGLGVLTVTCQDLVKYQTCDLSSWTWIVFRDSTNEDVSIPDKKKTPNYGHDTNHEEYSEDEHEDGIHVDNEPKILRDFGTMSFLLYVLGYVIEPQKLFTS